jgi:hypothetical protein
MSTILSIQSSIEFNPRDDKMMTQDTVEMILLTSSHTPSSKLLLDTQASTHMIANAMLIDDIGAALL